MKNLLKPVTMAVLACAMLFAPARLLAQEEYNFGGHNMAISEIVKEWHNQNLYSAGTVGNKMTIRNYIVGLAQAYPNDLLNSCVDYLLGFDLENSMGAMVLDEKNGYFKGEIFTELTYKVEMCYWRCDDGGVLVGVAFIGDEYRYDDNDDLDPILEGDDPDDRTTVCVNDLMFFRIFDGEMIWRPRLPVEMCGKRFDFRQYNIELPRVGKDVKLTHLGDPKQSVVLRWNGRRFDVVKMK